MSAIRLAEDGSASARDEFATLLESYRLRIGVSRNRLAGDVGVDTSYLTRIAHGNRNAPQPHIIDALARALRVTPFERNKLLAAGGYAPKPIIGYWDETLQACVDVMEDPDLCAEDRVAFQTVVVQIANRWRVAGQAKLRYKS